VLGQLEAVYLFHPPTTFFRIFQPNSAGGFPEQTVKAHLLNSNIGIGAQDLLYFEVLAWNGQKSGKPRPVGEFWPIAIYWEPPKFAGKSMSLIFVPPKGRAKINSIKGRRRIMP